jgi:hypothetical protein
MKLDIGQKLALATASFVAVALCIIAGSSASGGGPGFGPQNNPGMQGSQFGQADARGFGTQPTQGGPGFGADNNPGVSGSAYGRSTASEASSGRSDARNGAFQGGSSSAKEEVIDTDADSGNGKARSKGERETHNGDATGSAQMLSRISGETGVPVDTLLSQKSATGLGYGDLETANLLAKASGQSFDSIVAKFKAGEGFGKIAHDMGLNLGKIVSAAHRSSLENKGKGLGSEKGENSGKRSFEDSILYTGITPIPSATASRGVNPVPSASVSPQP